MLSKYVDAHKSKQRVLTAKTRFARSPVMPVGLFQEVDNDSQRVGPRISIQESHPLEENRPLHTLVSSLNGNMVDLKSNRGKIGCYAL